MNKVFSEIIGDTLKREQETLSPYACRSSEGIRKYPDREKVADAKNIRSVFFHDTDKIIHSLAYTRYIDKTQVFYLFESDHITHRALHVQFVSKIGRVIGRCLRLNEDLIEAISLGHDIGHPPYGHDGERILNRLCRQHRIGTFYHNVQSVRALTAIEQKGRGCNLSLQVLDGILAHNGEILDRKYAPADKKSWTGFEEELRNCFTRENFHRKIVPMTLEGCVARITDIIAYIGRDIEDAISLKLIKRKDLPSAIQRTLGSSNDKIINTLVNDLIVNSYNKPYLAFSRDIFRALLDLKKFNFQEIYSNERIKTEGYKINNMFCQLFQKYHEDLKTKPNDSAFLSFLADMDSSYHRHTAPKRKIIDFIAGMTDDFFNNQYKKLFVPQSFGYSL